MIYFEIRCEIFDWEVYVRKVIYSIGLAGISAKECVTTVLRSLDLEIHWHIDNLLGITE